VAAEIGHEAGERGIVVPAQKRQRVGMDGEVVLQLSPPRGTALEHQRRVDHVGAVVDPLLEALATGLGERPLQSLPYLMSTTFQPRFSNSAAIFMNSRSETTESRLWRL
jgi:hypothetical protein